MRYSPNSVGQDQLEAIAAPYLGGAWKVYLSHVPAVHLATIEFSAANTAALSDDIATALAGLPDGTDVQVMASTPIVSDVALVIALAAKDNTSPTPLNTVGTATFTPPAWVPDQSFHFQAGYAVDLIPSLDGQRFTQLTALNSAAGGAAGLEIDLFQLPKVEDWVAVGCTSDIRFNDKSRVARGVDCGLKADAFVLRGKTTPGDLSIRAKLKSMAEGLPRFSGRSVTCMLVGTHDDLLIGDRLVFTQFTPNVSTDVPDGDGEVMVSVDGKFVDLLMFMADYVPVSSGGGGGGAWIEPEGGAAIMEPEGGATIIFPNG